MWGKCQSEITLVEMVLHRKNMSAFASMCTSYIFDLLLLLRSCIWELGLSLTYSTWLSLKLLDIFLFLFFKFRICLITFFYYWCLDISGKINFQHLTEKIEGGGGTGDIFAKLLVIICQHSDLPRCNAMSKCVWYFDIFLQKCWNSCFVLRLVLSIRWLLISCYICHCL